MTDQTPMLSVIIPVYNDRENLGRCLDALEQSTYTDYEVIVVDDGSPDDSEAVAMGRADRTLRLDVNQGQAEARNVGSLEARSDILFFLDADITVEPDTLELLMQVMQDQPEYAALFCSYQENTPHKNFTSQYKNLLHHFTHQQSRTEAVTFCGGFGAIRKSVFTECGGFNKALRSMEDVDLGYRIHKKGYRIRSCPWIQMTHNKRYSLGSLIRSDVFQRAIPWTHVMLERRMYQNDLNTSNKNVVSLLLVYLMTLFLLLPGVPATGKILIELFLLVLLVFLNRQFLGFLVQMRGLSFAIQSLAMIFLQHLYSGFGLVAGVISYAWRTFRGR